MNILKCKFLQSLSGAYGLIYILKTPSSDCTNSHYIISSHPTLPSHQPPSLAYLLRSPSAIPLNEGRVAGFALIAILL